MRKPQLNAVLTSLDLVSELGLGFRSKKEPFIRNYPTRLILYLFNNHLKLAS